MRYTVNQKCYTHSIRQDVKIGSPHPPDVGCLASGVRPRLSLGLVQAWLT